MKMAEKEQFVTTLARRLGETTAVILAEYRGLKVSELTAMRRGIRGSGGEMRVIKNRLAQRAVEGTDLKGLSPHFKGPTVLVSSTGDPVPLSKVLARYLEAYEAFKVRVGYLGGRMISESELKTLARLPAREELYAKLMGTFQAPLVGFMRTLNAVPVKLAVALKEIEKKKGG